jgi:lysine biosynthesis protein LysW
MALTVNCPDCTRALDIEGAEIGDYFECETCFAELVVTSLEPAQVSFVEEEK